MITTGWPAASLAATCGSEPIDLAPPFGGRQGTRLKMSPADFATSFTLSIAFEVRVFCCAGVSCAGLACSVAATLALVAPVVVCGGAVLALSDLALSDLAWSESAACWATCACKGSTDSGVSATNAATAETANHVCRQKG